MTFWQVGQKVANRWNPESVGTIISIEESDQAYSQAGQKIKPKYPVEWCKVKFPDGVVREYAGHELLLMSSEQ